jgi:hypothetical protein
MVLVLWWSFTMAFVYKYAQTIINLFKRYDPAILDDDDELVGHASFSDSEEEDEEDDLPDGPMRDFYEETTLSPEWITLSEEEKRARLDKDLDEYMSKSKSKHE